MSAGARATSDHLAQFGGRSCSENLPAPAYCAPPADSAMMGAFGRLGAMYDLLIAGGTLIDGTGAPRRIADVAVAEGRIAAVGRLAGAAARRTIDAGGLVVMPGIFDAHTHYDAQLMWDP